MWKRLTAIGAFSAAAAAAAAISAVPAFAQQILPRQAEPPAAAEQSPMPSEPPQADQAYPGAGLVGRPVTSADGQWLGQVTRVNETPDGRIENVHIQIGYRLGIGERTVQIYPDQYSRTEDGIKLALTAKAAESLPEARIE